MGACASSPSPPAVDSASAPPSSKKGGNADHYAVHNMLTGEDGFGSDVPMLYDETKEFVLQRSTPLEIVLALVSAAGVGAGMYFYSRAFPTTGFVVNVLHAIMIFRFHFQIWHLGGWKGLMYISWRFPHAWIYTQTLVFIYNLYKAVEFVVHQCNFFFDDVGRLYRCDGRMETKDYVKMTMDLNKPHLFKQGSTYWLPTIYPYTVSPTVCLNVYVCGFYAGFGSLPIVYSDHHVTFHNDLFGTHPGYNNHVTLFMTDDRVAYWHVAALVLPPWTWFYKTVWEWYGTIMHVVIAESQQRTAKLATKTWMGDGLRAHEFEPMTLEQVWLARHGRVLNAPCRSTPEREIFRKVGVYKKGLVGRLAARLTAQLGQSTLGLEVPDVNVGPAVAAADGHGAGGMH